jgi:hypothetical protein
MIDDSPDLESSLTEYEQRLAAREKAASEARNKQMLEMGDCRTVLRTVQSVIGPLSFVLENRQHRLSSEWRGEDSPNPELMVIFHPRGASQSSTLTFRCSRRGISTTPEIRQEGNTGRLSFAMKQGAGVSFGDVTEEWAKQEIERFIQNVLSVTA